MGKDQDGLIALAHKNYARGYMSGFMSVVATLWDDRFTEILRGVCFAKGPEIYEMVVTGELEDSERYRIFLSVLSQL